MKNSVISYYKDHEGKEYIKKYIEH